MTESRRKQETSYRDGVWAMVPLLPAIVAFGASFGVLARAAGVDGPAAVAGLRAVS